jgi:hypothetical protein
MGAGARGRRARILRRARYDASKWRVALMREAAVTTWGWASGIGEWDERPRRRLCAIRRCAGGTCEARGAASGVCDRPRARCGVQEIVSGCEGLGE